MRSSIPLALAALSLGAPAARAQTAPSPAAQAVDRAGEAFAMRGAPGTVVPDSPGVATAPGVQAPFETPVPPSAPPRADAPAR